MTDHPASDQLLHNLLSLHPKRIDLSLDRLMVLLDKLGNPHLNCPPVVHIAGTNGKGSTVAFLKAMAQADGRVVHTYTSPHLVRFHERIGLFGDPIDEGKLAELLARVEEINAGEPITFFEVTTAAAFLAFAEHPADLLILETGLGGRFDATNVFERPLAVGLTPIDIDHQGFLGDTLSEIAYAKAGIIKPGVPAFTQPQKPQAMRVLEDEANVVGAPLKETAAVARDWILGLAGQHQFSNAGLAAQLANCIGISEAAQRAGAAKAMWPGRLQPLSDPSWTAKIPEGAQLWLDGAHNKAAAEELSVWLRGKLPSGETADVILGLMNNRAIEEFLAPFLPLKDQLRLHPLSIPGESSAHDPKDIVDVATGMGFVAHAADGVDAAFRGVREQLPTPSIVMVAGSLYLIGSLLRGDAPNVSEYGSTLQKPNTV